MIHAIRRFFLRRRIRRARSIYTPETWAAIRSNRRISAGLKRMLYEEGYFD
jgi:hypothetical protein